MKERKKTVQLGPNPPKFLSTSDSSWVGFKASKHKITNMKAALQLLLNLNSIGLQGFRLPGDKTWNA